MVPKDKIFSELKSSKFIPDSNEYKSDCPKDLVKKIIDKSTDIIFKSSENINQSYRTTSYSSENSEDKIENLTDILSQSKIIKNSGLPKESQFKSTEQLKSYIESSFITKDSNKEKITEIKSDITSNLKYNSDNEHDTILNAEYSSSLTSYSNLDNKLSFPSFKEIITQNNHKEDNKNNSELPNFLKTNTQLTETTEILFESQKNDRSHEVEESSLNISKGINDEINLMDKIINSGQEKLFESSNTHESLRTNNNENITTDKYSEETFTEITNSS